MQTYARIFAAVASATLTIANAPIADAASHCAGLKADTCATMLACKWLPPHKAGDVNPRTQQPFKRDSNGQCRLDASAASALAVEKVKASPKAN